MKNKEMPTLIEIYEQACLHQMNDEELKDLFDESINLDELSFKYHGVSSEQTAKRYRALGKLAIRMNQFKLAQHNASMAIFLGKQYLGQTEKVETTFNAENINELNKKIMESVAECRKLEDYE